MSVMDGICGLCGCTTPNVPAYNGWSCGNCGQEYDYYEDHCICLDEEQRQVLRRLRVESGQREEVCRLFASLSDADLVLQVDDRMLSAIPVSVRECLTQLAARFSIKLIAEHELRQIAEQMAADAQATTKITSEDLAFRFTV